MTTKECKSCEKRETFHNEEPTGYKEGHCPSCFSIHGTYLVDSSLNVYYKDDEGFKHSAPESIVEESFGKKGFDFIEKMYESDDLLPF